MLANLLFSSVWRKNVWRMNRSAKGLSMVTTNLDGFSLANCRRFAKLSRYMVYSVQFTEKRGVYYSGGSNTHT